MDPRIDPDTYSRILYFLDDPSLLHACLVDKLSNNICETKVWPLKAAKQLTHHKYSKLPQWNGRYQDLYYSLKGQTPAEILYWAAQHGYTSIIDYIIKSHKHLSSIDKSLIEASKNGYTNIVDLLLTYGADIHYIEKNIPDFPSGESVIYAAINGHLETVKYLISKGSDTENILYHSVMHDNLNLARYILENVTVKPIQLDEALAIAAYRQNIEISILLLDYGADPGNDNIFSEFQVYETAITSAIKSNNIYITNKFLECYPKYEQIAFELSILYSRPTIVKMLINRVELNNRYLMFAIREADIDSVNINRCWFRYSL